MPQSIMPQPDTANVVVDLQWGTIAQGVRKGGAPYGLDPTAQKAYLEKVAKHIEASRAQGIPTVWVSVNNRIKFHDTESSSSLVRSEAQFKEMGFYGGPERLTQEQKAAFDYYKDWLKKHGPRSNEAVYEKKSFGAFTDGPDLLNHINKKENKWTKINLIGGNDDVCVLATAIGAALNGIKVRIMADLVKGDTNPLLDKGDQHHVDKLKRAADNLLFTPDKYEGHLGDKNFSTEFQINDENKVVIRERISFGTSQEVLSSTVRLGAANAFTAPEPSTVGVKVTGGAGALAVAARVGAKLKQGDTTAAAATLGGAAAVQGAGMLASLVPGGGSAFAAAMENMDFVSAWERGDYLRAAASGAATVALGVAAGAAVVAAAPAAVGATAATAVAAGAVALGGAAIGGSVMAAQALTDAIPDVKTVLGYGRDQSIVPPSTMATGGAAQRAAITPPLPSPNPPAPTQTASASPLKQTTVSAGMP